MVAKAVTETTDHIRGSLRPMDPLQDLGAITDLIAAAFADEIDERGQAALREMRWMARLSPLLWWWAHTDPAFDETFAGFVWEEPSSHGKGREIVGNVSLNRAPGSRQRWIICNVVVQDKYRGWGIGRRLTEATIVRARDLGAEGVVLQVHADNRPALQLYTDLGFEEAAGEIDLRLDAVEGTLPADIPGYRFRAWQPADGQLAYEIARSATPLVQQWISPVRAGKYRLDWWARLAQRLRGLLTGRRVYRLVALCAARMVAMLTLTAAFRQGEHHLELLVHPEHAGQIEAALVSRALHMLAAVPSRPVRATVEKAHTATLNALRDYGFEEQRTLLTLRKDFR